MTQINIIGTIAGCSGYDIHTRSLANAINKIVPVRLMAGVPPGFEKMLNDRELDMLKRQPSNEINLIITNPAVWELNFTAKRNWVFLIWEGSNIPKWVIEKCKDKRIEKIFVASNHTKDAIEDKEILSKVSVMPHGVNLDLFYSKNKPNKLTFLCNKGFRNLEDRGGIQYAIKAYMEEFGVADDVEMIVKLNPAYGVPNLDIMMRDLISKTSNLPALRFDVMGYEYNALVNLYNSANVFVAPTRAEAFNIPCLEAQACGLPVITTNFGGQIDFCNNENGWLIDYELSEVKHELMYEGVKWATPNIDAIKKVMRECYENRAVVVTKGEKARENARKWTWDNTAEKIAGLI